MVSRSLTAGDPSKGPNGHVTVQPTLGSGALLRRFHACRIERTAALTKAQLDRPIPHPAATAAFDRWLMAREPARRMGSQIRLKPIKHRRSRRPVA